MISDIQRKGVKFFNDLAEFAADNNILHDKLTLYSYDTVKWGQPPNIRYERDLAQIYFFPSFNKEFPYR